MAKKPSPLDGMKAIPFSLPTTKGMAKKTTKKPTTKKPVATKKVMPMPKKTLGAMVKGGKC